MLREEGLRVVIYVNDHMPAHVHVFGDGEAKINLLAADGAPVMAWADNMPRGEVRRAMRLVAAQQMFSLQKWEDIHGGRDGCADRCRVGTWPRGACA